MLFAIPIIGFVFNDYMLFGLPKMFYGVISVRIALLIVTDLEFFYIQKVKSFQAYDKIVFFAVLAMLHGGELLMQLDPQTS